MFGIGMTELIVIFVIALIFLGPAKLPEAAKALGKGIRELRKHTKDLEQTIEQDEELGSTVRELKSALRGDPAPPAQRIQPPKPAPKPVVAVASPPPPPKAAEEPATKTEPTSPTPK